MAKTGAKKWSTNTFPLKNIKKVGMPFPFIALSGARNSTTVNNVIEAATVPTNFKEVIH